MGPITWRNRLPAKPVHVYVIDDIFVGPDIYVHFGACLIWILRAKCLSAYSTAAAMSSKQEILDELHLDEDEES